MQISLHLRPDVADSIHRSEANNGEAYDLLQAANRMGVVVTPLYPGARDEESRQQFVVEVEDPSRATHVLTHLRRCRATESAYLTPEPQLP